MCFIVHIYYTHSGYQTSLFGKKNCVYYIQIFTVGLWLFSA